MRGPIGPYNNKSGKKKRKKRFFKAFCTQQEFADYWDITQPRVSQLLAEGTIPRGGTRRDWDAAYAGHLRAIAAQHKSEDGIDIVKERALLDRRKRELLDMDLAQKRHELWPIAAISRVLHQHNTNAKNRWLSLPSAFKASFPEVSARAIDGLDSLVRENLTEQAHDQLPADIRLMVQRYFEELHSAAEADGQPVGRSVPQTQSRKQRRARAVANSSDPVPSEDNGRGQ